MAWYNAAFPWLQPQPSLQVITADQPGDRFYTGRRGAQPVTVSAGGYPNQAAVDAMRGKSAPAAPADPDAQQRAKLFGEIAKQYPEDPSDPTGRRLLPPQQSGSINITPAYGVGYGESLGQMPVFAANGGRTTALRAALPFLNHYQTAGLAPRQPVDMEARAQAAMSRAPVDAQFAMGGNSMSRLAALNQMRQAGLMPQGGGQMAAAPSMPLQSSGAPQIPIVPNASTPMLLQNRSEDGTTYINPENIGRGGFEVLNRNTASTNIDPATGRPRQLFVDIVDGRARLRPREDGPGDGSYTQPDGTVVSADEMAARRQAAIQNRRQRAADSLAARQRAMGVRPLQSNPVGSVASRSTTRSMMDQAFGSRGSRASRETMAEMETDQYTGRQYAGMSPEQDQAFKVAEAAALEATSPEEFSSLMAEGGIASDPRSMYEAYVSALMAHEDAMDKASKTRDQETQKSEYNRRQRSLDVWSRVFPEKLREKAKTEAESKRSRRSQESESRSMDGYEMFGMH